MVWLRRMLAAALLLAGFLLAAVALTVGLLNIAPLRRALFEAALEATRTDDMIVEIGALDGVWPGELRLRDLTLSDAEGVWLTLASAELDWRPLALWRGEVHITRVAVNGLDVTRLPGGGEEADAGFTLPEVPRLPFALRLDTFSLRNMRLGARLAGEEVLFEGDGHLVHSRRVSDIALRAARQDGRPGHIEGVYRFDAGPERGLLKLSVADGGPGAPSTVARLAGLEGVERLTIDIDGQSLAGLMTGTAKVDAGAALKLEADAHGAMAERVNLDFRLRAEGDVVARELDFIDGARDVTASGRLAETARGDYRLATMRIEAGGFSLTGDASATRRAALYDIEAEGSAAGVERFFDLDEGETFGPVGWRLRGTGDADGGAATIEEAALTGLGGAAKFTGEARIAFASGAAQVAGDIEALFADLAPLGRLTGQAMQGEARVRLSSFTFADGAGGGAFALEAGPVATGDEGLDRVLAKGATAEATLRFDAGGAMSVSGLTAAAGGATLEGDIAVTRSGALDGRASLSVAEIADLLAGAETRGALTAQATLGGTRDAARLALKAELSDGAAAGIDIERATLETELVQGGTGPALLVLEGDGGRARVATQVTLPQEGGARFDAIEANLFGAPLAGAVALSPDWIADGAVSGRRVTLAPFGRLAGVGLEGRADLSLVLADRQGKQDAALTLSSRHLEIDMGEPVTLERVEIAAALSDMNGAAVLEATLAADSGAAGNTLFSAVSASARGPLDDLTLAGALDGERLTGRTEAVSLAAQGKWQTDALTLEALSISLGETGLALAEPLRLEIKGETLAVKRLAMDFTSPSGPGSLTGVFALRPRAAVLTLDADNVPLAILTPLLPSDAASGTVSGGVALDTAREQGAVALRFQAVRLGDAELDIRPPFDATLDGAWAGRRLEVKALAHGVSEEPFRLEASLPLVRDPAGAWPALPARGPVSGTLTWRGPMASLMALADLSGQRLAGDAEMALSTTGDISAPVFSGKAHLTGGTFENFATGTVLRDLDMRLEGARSETLSFTLDARDNSAGRITSEGTITLAAGAARAVDIRTRFTRLQVARRQDLVLSVSGDLELGGAALPPTDAEPLTLSGALTTTEAHFRVPEQLPHSVPQIAVVLVNDPEEAATAQAAEEAVPLPVALDLALSIGNPPAQVTGRGVNALWTGALTVTGTADAPRITGTLSSLRGTLDFAGKTFTLSRGLVTFRGETPPDPTVDIALDYTRSGFKATVAVSGRGSAPQIALSSQPALPRDEIISRILFEKGVGELSAIEAAQLANTAAELSGAGGVGGFGLLGQMQQSLGLDVLRVDQGASGATTVAAGKYLREGFYVGVEQGALASDSSVKVEVDLTDNISVDTKVGQDASAGAGINWKWDY